MTKLKSEFDVPCPCCRAVLVIDTNLRRVVRRIEPENENKPELSDAERILADAAARREAIFAESVENERTRGDALSSVSRKHCDRRGRNRSPSRRAISISTERQKLRREIAPPVSPAVIERLPVGELLFECPIPFAERVDPLIRRPDRPVRIVEQHPLHLDVLLREPPIVVPHDAEIDDGVAGHTAGEIDVGIDVAQRQIARRSEDRLASVQAGVARAGD